MRLIWPKGLRLRAFYDPASHRVSLISDVLDDSAEGRIFADCLAVAFSPHGEFRDLEFNPGSASSAAAGPPNQQRKAVEEGAVVWLPEVSRPILQLWPEEGGRAMIRLTPSEPVGWVQLANTHVALGIADGDVLVAIYMEAVTEDPDGREEARWLDCIRA